MGISKTTKRGAAVAPLAVVAALGLGSGVALAAVLSSVNAEGAVKRGQFVAAWETGTGKTAASVIDLDAAGAEQGSGTTVTAPTVDASGKTLTVQGSPEVFYGQTLHVGGSVKVSGTSTGYVSGVAAKGNIPAGWQVSLKQGCGDTVASATPANISLRITPTADTGPDLDLKNLGLSIVVTKGTKPAGLVCATIPAS